MANLSHESFLAVCNYWRQILQDEIVSCCPNALTKLDNNLHKEGDLQLRFEGLEQENNIGMTIANGEFCIDNCKLGYVCISSMMGKNICKHQREGYRQANLNAC